MIRNVPNRQHAIAGPISEDAPEPTLAERARTLAAITRIGSLSTHSRKFRGFPFGSMRYTSLPPLTAAAANDGGGVTGALADAGPGAPGALTLTGCGPGAGGIGGNNGEFGTPGGAGGNGGAIWNGGVLHAISSTISVVSG